MQKLTDGKIYVNGTMAYVAQQAWIQNATFKENILFGKSYEEDFYSQVIYSCALIDDLDNLPAGKILKKFKRQKNKYQELI